MRPEGGQRGNLDGGRSRNSSRTSTCPTEKVKEPISSAGAKVREGFVPDVDASPDVVHTKQPTKPTERAGWDGKGTGVVAEHTKPH